MPIYNCAIIYYATKYVIVEADNEDEAEEKAYAQSDIMLCHACDRMVNIEDIDEVVVHKVEDTEES